MLDFHSVDLLIDHVRCNSQIFLRVYLDFIFFETFLGQFFDLVVGGPRRLVSLVGKDRVPSSPCRIRHLSLIEGHRFLSRCIVNLGFRAHTLAINRAHLVSHHVINLLASPCHFLFRSQLRVQLEKLMLLDFHRVKSFDYFLYVQFPFAWQLLILIIFSLADRLFLRKDLYSILCGLRFTRSV